VFITVFITAAIGLYFETLESSPHPDMLIGPEEGGTTLFLNAGELASDCREVTYQTIIFLMLMSLRIP
jgi:hypothetical protein